MNIPEIMFLLATLTTTLMTGLIWFVQIVHYPLFNQVGAEAFVNYEEKHTFRTGLVVVPIMLTELGTTVLLWFYRPEFVSLAMTCWLIGLTLLIWLSTFLLQVPQHNRLSRRFDESSYYKLVRTNWIRTIGWSVKTIICFGLLIHH
ncbi:MAG: hypothetical protein R3D00_30195 [Bacteroidia bacterium]